MVNIENEHNPIMIRLSGKKKLHPNYTGELEIDVGINQLLINFNAELLYAIIHKMTFQQPPPLLTPTQQDNFVLDLFSTILETEETK